MDSTEMFDDSGDEMDPRIKIELESLNQTASDINRLEKEINEARNKYQDTFYECSRELEILGKKYGRKINKARAYYETKVLSKEAQSEAMLSARKFQSANGVYLAAKETISLAELRLKDDKAASLSPAWQEMLNHALIRVMESEQEKTKSEKEHLEKSAIFAAMENKLHILEKKHKKSIEKAKSYFDSKSELETKLQQIKQTIEDLQQAIQSAKSRYALSLKNLEVISDGIHEARRQKLILMYPREPGVGAEDGTDVPISELPTLAKSRKDFDISCSSSIDDNDDDCCTDSDEDDDETDDASRTAPRADDKRGDCLDNEEVKVTERPVPALRVKEKHKLRKTMSLPSYVLEDEPEAGTRSIEIETDKVLLKIETDKIETGIESGVRHPGSENKVGQSSKVVTGRLILDPVALCSRDVMGLADGNS